MARESDADDGGEAAQLFVRGDTVRIYREDADGLPLSQALADRDLDQCGGFAGAGGSCEDHHLGGIGRGLLRGRLLEWPRKSKFLRNQLGGISAQSERRGGLIARQLFAQTNRGGN